MAHAGLSAVQVIKRLCNPESPASSQQAVQAALRLLDERVRASVHPDAYSLEANELDIWLDHLETLGGDEHSTPLLVYWMNRYAHMQQEFSQVMHQYRDPTLKRLGCVVIGQLVQDFTASLRTRLLEIIEDTSLTEVVFVSVISCLESESEAQLSAEFSGLVKIKSMSLVSFETKEQVTRLRNNLYQSLGLSLEPIGRIIMQDRLKKRIFG
jgi:hypothetical protein